MYKSWLEALKTPFWCPQRGAFLIFSKNAVEVEAVPQQVVEQGAFKQKKLPFHGTLWMLSLYMISKKQLNQFIEEKSPQWVFNAKSPCLDQEGPCHEHEGLGHHSGTSWLRVVPLSAGLRWGQWQWWDTVRVSGQIWLCVAILALSCSVQVWLLRQKRELILTR